MSSVRPFDNISFKDAGVRSRIPEHASLYIPLALKFEAALRSAQPVVEVSKAYPAKLPVAITGDYALEPQSSFIRSEMETGPARQRRRFTTAPTLVSLSWIFTLAEMSLFEAWYEHAADDGAGWVTMPLANGKGCISMACRFVEPWKAMMMQSAQIWKVTGKVEIRARPVISRAELRSMTNA